MSHPPANALDFRSDTVTQPTSEMRAVLASAEVGDDYYRDDPTVNALEEYTATLLGKEAALLTSSGTQSNLIAIMTQTDRGASCLLGDQSHSFTRELGGLSFLAGIQPIPVENQPDGTFDMDAVERALVQHGILSSPRQLLLLENSFNGRALPMEFIETCVQRARTAGLSCHLDGARLFNAALASGHDAQTLAAPFDTISICLSKGLGAPFGSVLAGPKETIEAGRAYRQALGGGLRQAGILASAGLYALRENRTRLVEDHARAKRLAEGLRAIDGVSVEPPQTNMVFATLEPSIQSSFGHLLSEAGIQVSGTPERQRWVTHLGIDEASMKRTLSVLAEFGMTGK